MDYETKSSFDSFELQLTPVAQGFLKEIAKWAKFISIVGYIGLALYVIIGLGMIAGGSAMETAASGSFGSGAGAAMSPRVMGVIYIVFSVLYFFPIMYLNKFAAKAQNALDGNHTDSLTESLENLKSHYKFMGILLIVILILMVLGFLLALIGIGAMAAM